MEQFLTSLIGNALLVHVIMAVIPLLFILPYALVVIYLDMKIAAHICELAGTAHCSRLPIC